jgi:hypothetical protein
MNKMFPWYSDTCSSFPYFLTHHSIHIIIVVFAIVTFSFLTFDLQNAIIFSTSGTTNDGIAYAHIFSDTENSVTKNVDGKYQVAFLPYPSTPVVNDTSTKLSFSIMENNTDVPNLFTSLIILDKNTKSIVEQTPYKFHEFGDVTYPYTFRSDGDYTAVVQAKINGNPKYESSPLKASFDISVQNMEKSSNLFSQIMLFYVTPVMAVIVGTIIYIDRKREKRKKM